MHHLFEPDIDVRDRIRGCLLGAAIGDAWGMPVETLDRESILAATDGRGVRGFIDPLQTRIPDTARLRAGMPTDDLQIIMTTTRSLIRAGGIALDDQARELVCAHLQSPISWGRSMQRAAAEFTLRIISKGRIGRAPDEPAPPPDFRGTGCGNGAAIRGIPVALAYRSGPRCDFMDYLRVAMRLGLQTHGDPRASHASVALGAAIGVALTLTPPIGNVERSFAAVAADEAAEKVERRVTAAVRIAEHWYEAPDADGRSLPRLSETLDLAWRTRDCADRLRTSVGTDCYALQSVTFAVATYSRHPFDFEGGVAEAVNAGGDTDSTGCMVGAMIGATVGARLLPPHLVEGLYQHGVITRAADRLAALVPP